MKRCMKCSSLMPDDATKCIRCGFESQSALQPTPSMAAPQVARPAAHKLATPAAAAKRGRIRGGWALAVQSWRVLMLDKALLVFPLASGISCLLVMASFVAGAWASGIVGKQGSAGNALVWALIFAWYFINYFIIVFFNSGLVACAMVRFRGGNPTVKDGLRAARERIAQIAAWALLAATVGVTLKIIEGRVKFVVQIVTALLGAAWTIATYFAVPVLVVEKIGPIDAARRSVTIIKQFWGESIVSNVGVGLLTFLAVVFLVIPTGVAAAVLAVNMSSLAVGLAGVVLTLVLLILVSLVGSALNSIVLSALYLYATEGEVPQAFEAAQLQEAFVAR